ncbi:MAG: response regulator [Anaerolineales bacterium]
MIKIIIVDDHVLFREGLSAILSATPEFEIAGMAGSIKDAVQTALALRPDVMLMDYRLPDGFGTDAAKSILAEHPKCKILFLTMSEDEEVFLAAIRSGAKGFLLKNLQPAKLVSAIRSVYEGESAISRSMTLWLMEEFARTKPSEHSIDPRFAKLTQREMEVLIQIAANKSNQQIAEELFISPNTVKSYIHSILDKLGMADRKEAGKFASESGLLEKKPASGSS